MTLPNVTPTAAQVAAAEAMLDALSGATLAITEAKARDLTDRDYHYAYALADTLDTNPERTDTQVVTDAEHAVNNWADAVAETRDDHDELLDELDGHCPDEQTGYCAHCDGYNRANATADSFASSTPNAEPRETETTRQEGPATRISGHHSALSKGTSHDAPQRHPSPSTDHR